MSEGDDEYKGKEDDGDPWSADRFDEEDTPEESSYPRPVLLVRSRDGW